MASHTRDNREASSRLEMLIGSEKLRLLEDSHVTIFGLGGVGGYATETLARSFVGRFTLIDYDTVSESNLNRQIIALRSTIGMYKTEIVRNRILDINPNAEINIHTATCSAENVSQLIDDSTDFIIDAIDMVSGKIAIISEAHRRSINMISCMGTGNKLDPTKLTISDIYKTETCPLCRAVRKQLRQLEIPSLKVLYSTELPHREITPETDKRPPPASMMPVPAVAGILLARECMRVLGVV